MYLSTPKGIRITILSAALSLLVSCQNEEEEIDWVGPPAEAVEALNALKASSPDRLPPGELLEGSEKVFGFAVPKETTLTRTGLKTARIEGKVDFEQLTEYVRLRIAARHAEMLGGRLVFRKARIKGVRDKVFEFVLLDRTQKSILLIEDQTRPPRTHGLSEEERWKRAGFKRGGGVIDRNALE